MTAERIAVIIVAIFLVMGLYVRLAEPDRTRKAGLFLDPFNVNNYTFKFVPEEKSK